MRGNERDERRGRGGERGGEGGERGRGGEGETGERRGEGGRAGERGASPIRLLKRPPQPPFLKLGRECYGPGLARPRRLRAGAHLEPGETAGGLGA